MKTLTAITLLLLLCPLFSIAQDKIDDTMGLKYAVIDFEDNIEDAPKLQVVQPLKLAPPEEGRKWYKPFITKNDIVIYSLQAISGAASGFGDMLVYHKHTFMRKYPNADFNWWIPEYSQGRRGWMMTRDGIHMIRAIEHTANYVSIGFSFSELKGLSAKQCILLGVKRAVISAIVNRSAFYATYNIWFNDDVERRRAGLDVD